MEGYIILIKQKLKNSFDAKPDPHIPLLQIRSTILGPEPSSPATLLSNYPIRGIMPTIKIPLIGINNNDEHYEALVKRQIKINKNHETPRNYSFIPKGSSVVVVVGKGNHDQNNKSYTMHITKTG